MTVCLSVCLSVCLYMCVCVLSATVSPEKTDEPIEMLFGGGRHVWSRKNHESDGECILAPSNDAALCQITVTTCFFIYYQYCLCNVTLFRLHWHVCRWSAAESSYKHWFQHSSRCNSRDAYSCKQPSAPWKIQCYEDRRVAFSWPQHDRQTLVLSNDIQGLT